MRGDVFNALVLPAAFWHSSDTLDALAGRDIAQLFRLVQRVTGASQTKIGIATGLSQAQVSEIMSGRRQVTTIDVLGRIVAGFAVPANARSVLLLGDRGCAEGHVAYPASEPTRESTMIPAPLPRSANDAGHRPSNGRALSEPFSDVTAVYATRSEFTSTMPLHALFDGAHEVRATGLSLNILCQHYADNHMMNLIEGGASVRCLFLDPAGQAIRARETEEGWPAGHLSSLTALNLKGLQRVRERLTPEKRDNLCIGLYDETIRFNIILVDDDLCIAQPYLPDSRGVDAPTLVIRRRWPNAGLYPTFEQIFNSLWGRARPQ